ncbi:ECA polysaccharide chain length modulation protein [Pseudomonas fluorescens]|uniref:LPS O-antigen chain length determinant protein WzzB n=1 Tax=Pseudomonas fluorescens TaxID=294 RepID=UPI00123EFF10|nr:Wzz/FepE/Etk N-terminal domain-containing protein [Pseudomonas fluorescens]VVP78258.1 ECA polysaccharide chain length modulation protein [Pseudomonas fluorescens]
MVNARQHRNASDEIDLTNLFKGLWAQKVFILLCTAIVFLAAAVYAWKATPIYEARFLVQPPTQNDVANLNYGRGGDSKLPELTVKDVYDVYRKHLQSESLRLELFRTLYLPTLSEEQRNGPQNALFSGFSRSLVVSPTSKDDPTRFTITATVPNPVEAVEWVTGYALKAGDKAKEEVLKNVKADATVKANNLQQEIDTLQISSRNDRADQIVRLSEALIVAKSIGLERPPIIAGKLSAEVSSGMDGALTYMRGSKALEAEIDNLQKRQTDDPFIKKLRAKQESLSFYRTLDIDPASVAVFRQDGVVAVPDQPIKPRKMLILAIGLGFGFAIGIFLALVRFLLLEKFAPQRSF